MFKRLFFLALTSALAVITVSCGGGSSLDGDLNLQADLSLSSLATDAGDLTPVFDPRNPGPYRLDVGVDVDTVLVSVGEPGSDNVLMSIHRQVDFSSDNRSGRAEEQDIAPNGEASLSLVAGDNLIVVRLRTRGGAQQFVDYSLSIHREDTNANLGQVVFHDFLSSTVDLSERLQLISPAVFSPDVTEYALVAPFSVCTLRITPLLESRFATLTINGERARDGARNFLDLNVGSNVIELVVTAESGAEKTYTFTVNREAAEQADIDNNVSLAQLTFSSGDITSTFIESDGSGNNIVTATEGFHCAAPANRAAPLLVRVNNDQETVSVSAIPNIDVRTVRVAELTGVDEMTGEDIFGTFTDIPAMGSVPLALEVGSNNGFGISLSDDSAGNPVVHYRMVIQRTPTNWRVVSTGAALQAALQAAAPNDEIVIAASSLTASSASGSSGKEGSVFFSDASGTAEAPIILRSLVGTTELMGVGAESDDILFELQGDHWEIRNIALSRSGYGVVLDGASHNRFETVFVNDMGQRGVQLRNASHDNGFAALVVSNIGSNAVAGADSGEALVIGSDPNEWSSAPVPGPYEPGDNDNVFTNAILGPDVRGELVDVKAGSERTKLFNFILSAQDVGVAAERASAVVIKGNDTELSYSSFELGGDSVLTEAVAVLATTDSWVTGTWGQGTQVFDNTFDFGAEMPVPAVNVLPGASTAFVHENIIRGTDIQVIYAGDVDEGFESPLYQIQLADDVTSCLTRQAVDSLNDVGEVIGSIALLLADTCAANDNQYWNFVNEGNGVVLIREPGEDGTLVVPSAGGNFSGLSSNALTSFAVNETNINGSSFLRWVVNAASADELVFTNQFDTRYVIGLVSLEANDSFDTDLRAAFVFNGVNSQRFTLVPVQ